MKTFEEIMAEYRREYEYHLCGRTEEEYSFKEYLEDEYQKAKSEMSYWELRMDKIADFLQNEF